MSNIKRKKKAALSDPLFWKDIELLYKFYIDCTKNYTCKQWKDGRLVFTPKIKNYGKEKS